MTILKKILRFNQPIKEVDCIQCKGIGKIKTPRISTISFLWSTTVGFMAAYSILKLISKPNLISLTLSIIFFVLSILTILEYNQQTKEDLQDETKS